MSATAVRSLFFVTLALLGASSLQAAPILTVTEMSGGSEAARLASKATTLSGLGPYTILEDFEGFTASANPAQGATSLLTGAGTFTRGSGFANGTGGSCITDGGACQELHVLDAATTPFSGRFNTTPGLAPRAGNWLDSNDITRVRLDLLTARKTLFFFLSDVSDQGGTLTLRAFDGAWSEQTILPTQASGDLFFVSLSSAAGISAIELNMNRTADGWGIDDIGTADSDVPEPTSLLLVGAGLMGVARRARRRR